MIFIFSQSMVLSKKSFRKKMVWWYICVGQTL